MEIKKYTLFYFVVVIFLIVIVMLQLLFNSVTSKNTQCPPQANCDLGIAQLSPINNSLLEELNNLKLRYNQLENKYFDLFNITNKIYDEKEFWKGQDSKKGIDIMLCWDKNIGIPDKTLEKRQVCREGCYYKLYCTASMKPFFDCTDTMTVYTNVEEDEIELCDVIGFKTPEYLGDWVVHRVINITNEGYVTKGDARPDSDNYVVKFEDVIFKMIEVRYE